MRNLAAILCIALIVAGCGRQRPGGVLSRNDMAAVLIDYHLAYQMAQELPANERYKAPIYIESALSKHGISQSNFDKSMQWYAGNPHELQIVYSRVNKDLKDLETAISDNATSGEAITFNRYRQHSFPIGDSVNVWQQESVYQLTSLFSQRRMQALISPDTTFQAGDRLELEFTPRFIGKGKAAIVMLTNNTVTVTELADSIATNTDSSVTVNTIVRPNTIARPNAIARPNPALNRRPPSRTLVPAIDKPPTLLRENSPEANPIANAGTIATVNAITPTNAIATNKDTTMVKARIIDSRTANANRPIRISIPVPTGIQKLNQIQVVIHFQPSTPTSQLFITDLRLMRYRSNNFGSRAMDANTPTLIRTQRILSATPGDTTKR